MNDLVNKWEKTGLLEATNPQDRFELAMLLEDLCQHLINKKADELQGKLVVEHDANAEKIAGFVLPILVRIYNERREVCPNDMGWLLEDFVDYYNRKYKEFKDLEKYHTVDGEAEFCEAYVISFDRKGVL